MKAVESKANQAGRGAAHRWYLVGAIAAVVVGGVIAIESCGDHGGLRSVGADSGAGQGGSTMGFGGQQGEGGAGVGGVAGSSSESTGGGRGAANAGGAATIGGTGGVSAGTGGSVSLGGRTGAVQDSGAKIADLDVSLACGSSERLRLSEAIRSAVRALDRDVDSCYIDPNFGRDGTVVFNDQGQVVDTTIKCFDPYPSAKQVWLASLTNERWPCLAGYTVWVRCDSKQAGL